jgi:hypothetical protein
VSKFVNSDTCPRPTTQRCQKVSQQWARRAAVVNPGAPLVGFDESLWDLSSAEWRELEDCVRNVAGQAGASVKGAWEEA